MTAFASAGGDGSSTKVSAQFKGQQSNGRYEIMHCRICGDENGVTYRPTKRQALCESCNADTPDKVSRDIFNRYYWPKEARETVPDSTKAEFYSDYLASEHNLMQYIDATTTAT